MGRRILRCDTLRRLGLPQAEIVAAVAPRDRLVGRVGLRERACRELGDGGRRPCGRTSDLGGNGFGRRGTRLLSGGFAQLRHLRSELLELVSFPGLGFRPNDRELCLELLDLLRGLPCLGLVSLPRLSGDEAQTLEVGLQLRFDRRPFVNRLCIGDANALGFLACGTKLDGE